MDEWIEMMVGLKFGSQNNKTLVLKDVILM